MNDNDIKERLSTYRMNKTLLWQTMLLTTGSTIGLLLKALNTRTNPVELFLMIMGFALTMLWFYLIDCISNDMENLHQQLKKEEIKNEYGN